MTEPILNLSALEKEYGLPSGLLSSVMQAESGGDPNARSPRGALGLFQFMPDTAKQYGIDPLDPQQSARGAAMMFSDLIDKYGNVPSALAAYNWGQGNLDRKGMSNAPQETRGYIDKILNVLNPISTAQAQEMPQDEMLDLSSDEKITQPIKSDQTREFHDVEMPDGTIIQDVPAGTTQAQLMAMLQKGIPEGEPNFTDLDTLMSQAKPWSSGVAQVPITPMLNAEQDAKKESALKALYSPNSVMADLTGYGANAIAEIPGLKESGSALAALAGYGKGDTFGARYADLEASQKAMREASKEKSPYSTMAGQFSGAVTGLGLLGKLGGAAANALPTKTTTALVDWATSHPKLADMGLNGILGSIFGFDEGEDQNSRISNAATTGALAAGLSIPFGYASRLVAPALEKAGSAIGNVLSESSAPIVSPASKSVAPVVEKATTNILALPTVAEEAEKVARQTYSKADDLGGALSPKGTNKVMSVFEGEVPKTEAERIAAKSDPVKAFAAKWSGIRDNPLSLTDAQLIDKDLQTAIDKSYAGFKATTETRDLMQARSKFREILSNPSEGDMIGGNAGFMAWRQAQQQWAQLSKLREMEAIQRNAEMSLNYDTAIKASLKNILKNSRKSKWYSPSEIKAMEAAQKTGAGEWLVKLFASGLNKYAAAVAGSAGGPVGAIGGFSAAAATEKAAKSGMRALKSAQMERVKQAIVRADKLAKKKANSSTSTAVNVAATKLLSQKK